MEISLKNINYLKLHNVDIAIKSSTITTITGDDTKKLLLDLFYQDIEYSGSILFDNKQLEYVKYHKYITTISTNFDYEKSIVIDEVRNQIKDYNCKYIKKSLDALLIVGLINKKDELIKSLSTGEKVLLNIAIALAKNPKIIIFDDIFYLLDNKNRKLLIQLFNIMSKKYHKTIILITNNIDYAYQISKEFIFIKQGEVLTKGDKEIFYQEEKLLKSKEIDIPEIVKFIQLAYNKKSIILYHRNDVKDLMKDIYRSVI